MSECSAAAPALWRHPEFRRGAREMVGVALGISAWGVVAGVAMANSSLGTAWAIVMSLVVFSGTGQIASQVLQRMQISGSHVRPNGPVRFTLY